MLDDVEKALANLLTEMGEGSARGRALDLVSRKAVERANAALATLRSLRETHQLVPKEASVDERIVDWLERALSSKSVVGVVTVSEAREIAITVGNRVIRSMGGV